MAASSFVFGVSRERVKPKNTVNDEYLMLISMLGSLYINYLGALWFRVGLGVPMFSKELLP